MDDAGVDAGADDAGSVFDAGSDDAGVDAGTDGGEPDAGPSSMDALTLSASTDDEQRIRLSWDAGAISSAISVLRNGQVIATVASGVSRYDDFDASSGALGGFDAGATLGLPSGIELEWTVPSSEPGVLTAYRIRAVVDGGVLESNEAIGQRPAPVLLEWMVAAGGVTRTIPASQTRWLDTNAPSPIVILGPVTATATPNDETSSVVLSADASVQRTPQPVTYTLTAQPSSGPAAFAKATGERGGLRPEYQWQRSTADSPDAGWADLSYVHGRLWFDADAVFNEGRYYRVVLRAGAQESISNEPRALLWRPRAFGMSGNTAFIQREDGLVMGFGAWRPQAQFEPSAQFVVGDDGACLLLSDAGVECLSYDGTVRSLGLPPATRIYGGGPICVSVLDGGVQCGPSAFDPSGLVSVIVSKVTAVCGERAADAGIRCQTNGGGFGVSPRPIAMWSSPGLEGVIASYPGAVTYLPIGTPAPLPIEDAGYVGGSSFGSVVCGIRDDGQLRCAGGPLNWGLNPPLGVELFDQFELGCGLTRDHRVRCTRSLDFRSLPPPPPVRQVRVFQDAYYLLENGLIAGRGPNGGPYVLGAGPALLDRFSQLPRGFSDQQCALRVDQSAACWGNAVAPSTGRYSKLVRGYGLRVDGGVDSWGLPMFQNATDLLEADQFTSCARHPDGSWQCFPPLPVPLPSRAFTHVVRHSASTCALEAGKVDCWPVPPPAHVLGRRFRHLSGGDNTNTTCGVTLEGEVICWPAAMPSTSPIDLPWDDFETFEWSARGGCGVRRDGTAPCIGIYRAPWE